jgi:hypothetical protein
MVWLPQHKQLSALAVTLVLVVVCNVQLVDTVDLGQSQVLTVPRLIPKVTILSMDGQVLVVLVRLRLLLSAALLVQLALKKIIMDLIVLQMINLLVLPLLLPPCNFARLLIIV